MKFHCNTDDIETFEVANTILEYLEQKELECTHLKLQKLLYFAYGAYLIIKKDNNDSEVLFQSKIEAWHSGPVVRCVYYEFKNCCGNVIPTNTLILVVPEETFDGTLYAPLVSKNAYTKHRAIEIVCNMFGKYNNMQLNELIHRPHTAWSKNYKEKQKHEIPKEDILKEFTGLKKYLDK